jgi:hypothetical protein
MLSKKEKQAYVQSRSGHCPYCHSQQLEGGSYQGDGQTIAQEVECLDCHKRWRDIYTLTDIEERQ